VTKKVVSAVRFHAPTSPDIIFTQDVDVCQIDTSHVARSIYKLSKEPELIALILGI
jgi:iron complex transport system substrate-binding protein